MQNSFQRSAITLLHIHKKVNQGQRPGSINNEPDERHKTDIVIARLPELPYQDVTIAVQITTDSRIERNDGYDGNLASISPPLTTTVVPGGFFDCLTRAC